jgi:hypothetical protein
LVSKNIKIKIHRNKIFPLIDERRLRVLRRILGPKRDEATGEWRILYNE